MLQTPNAARLAPMRVPCRCLPPALIPQPRIPLLHLPPLNCINGHRWLCKTTASASTIKGVAPDRKAKARGVTTSALSKQQVLQNSEGSAVTGIKEGMGCRRGERRRPEAATARGGCKAWARGARRTAEQGSGLDALSFGASSQVRWHEGEKGRGQRAARALEGARRLAAGPRRPRESRANAGEHSKGGALLDAMRCVAMQGGAV